MTLLATFHLPLAVNTTKSGTKKGKAILNLNNYRNWFSIRSNAIKKEYKRIIQSQINSFSNINLGHFLLEYTYIHGNNRKLDVANPLSIIDKFTCDALTELNFWPDDNIDYVKEVRYKWGGVDPNKIGYCELKIYKL